MMCVFEFEILHWQVPKSIYDAVLVSSYVAVPLAFVVAVASKSRHARQLLKGSRAGKSVRWLAYALHKSGLAEEQEEVDPLEAFAGQATNRLEQDLLLAKHGLRTRQVMARLARYKAYMTQAGAERQGR